MFLVRFYVSQKIFECREQGRAVQRARRKTVYPSLVFWKITTDSASKQENSVFCLKKQAKQIDTAGWWHFFPIFW